MGGKREEELQRVLVDGLQPVLVELADSNPSWPAIYDTYAAGLRSVLGQRIRLIEHIGSTSVPGLSAKPIIDIVIGVDDPEDESTYLTDLLSAGWDLRVREPGHRCLRGSRGTAPANLHCYRPDDSNVVRYQVFRDQLRRDSADRARYEAVKRSLAGRVWPDMNLYADAKSDVIAEILGRAMNDRGRWVSWDGVSNAKDLGGLPIRSGGFTQRGRVFRSGHLDDLTSSGWSQIRDAGVETVIDLRNDFELSSAMHPAVSCRWLPIEDHGDAEFMNQWRESLDSPAYHRAALDRWPAKMAAVFREMAAAPPGAVLFHCVSGRDRTGLVTALLLRLVDVPVREIVDDYASSVRASSEGRPPPAEGVAQLTRLLEAIDVRAYLAMAGLSVASIDAVRDRLL